MCVMRVRSGTKTKKGGILSKRRGSDVREIQVLAHQNEREPFTRVTHAFVQKSSNKNRHNISFYEYTIINTSYDSYTSQPLSLSLSLSLSVPSNKKIFDDVCRCVHVCMCVKGRNNI